MISSNFFTNLIIPLNLCIALLLVGAVCFIVKYRKTAIIIMATGIGWVAFWSVPATSLWAGGHLEQLYRHELPRELPTVQAIVVLGGNTANNRLNWFEPYNRFTASPRVDTAAILFDAHRAPLIVVSGAALEGKVSEAQAMAHALSQHGIPEEALILETQSSSTYENGLYTAAKLHALNISNVLLVTSALHMPRAMAVFRKQGISAIAAPSAPQIVKPDDPAFSVWLPNMRALDASRSIIKEYAALMIYWVRGWI